MKTKFLMVICASLTLLVSATVWEGVTDVVSGKDLPGNFSVATNSFPRNSVVDITNLENGKVVRVLVVSGLETTGLLATLSRNAADSIDLRGNSTGRIRITQPADDIAFSNFKLGPVAAVSPAAEPETLTRNTAYPADEKALTGTAAVIAEPAAREPAAQEPTQPAEETAVVTTVTRTTETVTEPAVWEPVQPAERTTVVTTVTTTTETIPATPTAAIEETAAEPVVMAEITETIDETPAAPAIAEITAEPVIAESAEAIAEASPTLAVVEMVIEPLIITETAEVIAEAPAVEETITAADVPAAFENPPELNNSPDNLSIIPSEERIPAADQFVIAPEDIAPAVSTAPPPAGTSDFSPFQAPLISRLEQGKCYVQVAAYRRVDHVEDEISRIGSSYPLAVQNIGTDANPMFRILLGPLNQGESGALLQRFKSIGYNDAFIRYN
ncbi:MAG: hypothetical protein LBH20_11380 [Treponema sp.]|jgi:rare lipoprotein A (peptidoglycan hydrolase)|nr:hypothetical protein [Treponema sp.]